MCAKTRRVFVRVTQRQHETLMAKARSYGVPLSRLVLLAVEAYVRTYSGELNDERAVAVNYGVWSRVDRDLGDIDAMLREATHQLVGVRWTLASCQKAGLVTHEEHEAVFSALKAVRGDVAHMRADVARCTELIDAVCERTSIVDPYMGPLEGLPASCAGDAADDDEATPEGR